MQAEHLHDLLEGLQAGTSPKRRSAAKRLRRLKDRSAGPALLDALLREVRDIRTWETQYQMIMAIAECGYEPALPHLRELARRDFEATSVHAALGDAIVRLDRHSENDPTPVLELMATANRSLIDGAFRAVAMLRLVFNPQATEAIITYASSLDRGDGLRFWVAAAAPGWSGPAVEGFLAECARSSREDVRTAAIDAQQGKYRTWRPL